LSKALWDGSIRHGRPRSPNWIGIRTAETPLLSSCPSGRPDLALHRRPDPSPIERGDRLHALCPVGVAAQSLVASPVSSLANPATATPDAHIALMYRSLTKLRPVFDLLTKEAKDKVLKGNYERIFDQGRRNVRAWEQAHALQR
jgi:hypothetical protein